MIKLEKLNGAEIYLNPHLIERVEERPDTVITMDSQVQYLVKNKAEDIIKLIINYRQEINFQPGQE